MLSIKLYIAQRLTAMLMAPLVLLHLGVMIYAIQGGLSSGEILGRTQGSFFWGLIYGLFVVALSIHAAIGLRVVIYEWLGVTGARLNWITTAIVILLLGLGSKAVYAVVMS
ncbi:succinate dehydrogenase [Cocleimonas flava]|uniref:Fumarate reductase subunit C n=1 Tax=Cocleimonas flava TaxID=634765 RepID=A0A4R1EYL8_9GAMM|nr:succinate dehydrogenase [Cocleimonas flava]TCJ83121.1 fumarate reductase subunit C [Cocleimonas flava]